MRGIASESRATAETATLSSVTQELARSLAAKFDLVSSGVILVEREGYGAAGIEPYKGAALALVPRILLPSKPTPGSIDGTYFGIPSRLVGRRLGMDQYAGGVGVGPVAISIWQWGYWGVAVFVISAWVLLLVFNYFFHSRFLFCRAMAIFSLPVPTIHCVISSPDTALMTFLRLGITVGVCWAYVWFSKPRLVRRLNTHQQRLRPGRGFALRNTTAGGN